jgi:hypothetical protein
MPDIRTILDADEKVAHLEDIGAPDFEVTLPSAVELPGILLDLAVPHEDIDPLVALRPESADLRWLLDRCTHSLVRRMGELDGPPVFPELPDSAGPLRRYFPVYVFLAVLPHVQEFHRSHGISEEVSRRTLRDLGRYMAVHRQRFGIGGFDVVPWLMNHFRGTLYDLGRLQFERSTLDTCTGNVVTAAGLPYGPGDPALGVHIPEFSGPLSPAACDAALARVPEFFATHFPAERYAVATCHSWLLDEQLAEYLAAESNIIRFQRRFRQAYQPADDDSDTMLFVFGRTDADLDQLPRDTRLQRAIIDHQKSGRHWRIGSGWLDL